MAGLLTGELIGEIGALLLVVAWAFQTRDTLRKRHSGLTLPFDCLYLAGSLLLTLYALGLDSWVFAGLNALAAAMALIGVYFKLAEKRPRVLGVWKDKKAY